MDKVHRLVLLLARPQATAQDIRELRRLARLGDWARVARAARAAGASGLVHRNLVRLGEVEVPAPAREALARDYRATLAGNLLRLQGADEVLTALAGRGIDAVLLKGALLVETHYGDPGLRPMRDVDLMVRPEALGAAEAALAELGYARTWTPGRRASAERYYQRAYERGADKVELHTAPCDLGRYPVDIGTLWGRARAIAWRGRQVLALDPADHLVYLVVHAALHGFLLPLTSVADVALVLWRDRDLLAAAVERAQAWGAGTAVHLGLTLAHDLCGAPVDEAALWALRPGWLRRAWLRCCFRRDRMPAFRFGGSLRTAQALTLLPLMEGGRGAYLWKYARLRIEDALARAPGKP
jgi:hypothetical protein